MSKLQDKIKSRLSRSVQAVDLLAERGERGLQRATGHRSCVALTGFSQAGKSTLLTAVVNQLLYPELQQAERWWPQIKHRWLSAKLIEASCELPAFPHASANQQLLNGSWPESTTGMSRCLIEIRLKPRSRLEDLRGKGYVTHELELWDYPGEWLMDLPLATMSYTQWVRETYVHFNNEPRNELGGDLYQRLLAIDPYSSFDAELFAALMLEYRALLLRCKDEAGLLILNPGRFLLEPERNLSPQDFLPLFGLQSTSTNAPKGSWLAQMELRYQSYVDQQVKPFFETIFAKVDHQLVLIDLLGSLSRGKSSLEELRKGLTRVLHLFDYGRNGLLQKLWSPKVEQLTFIASKLDCVLPSQRHGLAELMRAVVTESIQAARFESTQVNHLELAAVACTRVAQRQGQAALTTQTAQGPAWLKHPQLPQGWPTDKDWLNLRGWQQPHLSPPPLEDPQSTVWPNINLDKLCAQLLKGAGL